MSKAICQEAVEFRVDGIKSCVLLLTGAILLLMLALLPFAIWLQGTPGLPPLTLAALINFLVGLTALAVIHLPALRSEPLISMLLATVLRLVPLIAISLMVVLTRGKTAHLDFIGYLVLFHLVTLALETYVAVQLAQSSAAHVREGRRA